MTKKDWAISISRFVACVVGFVFFTAGALKYLEWTDSVVSGDGYWDLVRNIFLVLSIIVLFIVWAFWVVVIGVGLQVIGENLEDL